jgi:hypothetical protein
VASVVGVPSAKHEAVVAMVRDRPTFPADLIRSRGFELPEFERAQLVSADLSNMVPTEFRADGVVRYGTSEAGQLVVVYEVQLKKDEDKRRSWPAYVANAHERAGCPVMLLVISPSRTVAEWCALPIVVGEPGFVLTPVVYGPDAVPVVTDPEQARRHPQLAVLSAMAHGRGPDAKPVLDALVAALDKADLEHADLYARAVIDSLPKAARSYLEERMAIERRFHLDFLQASYERGHVKGEADALLQVLQARGIQVPGPVRDRIIGCTDDEQLLSWVRRAVTARTVDDLFDMPEAA